MFIDAIKNLHNRRPIVGLSNPMNTAHHGIIVISIILLVSPAIPAVGAQSAADALGQNPNQFSPSVAAIIIVLIAALFFMGFFSVYIRQCSENSSGGASIRQLGGIGVSLRRRLAARGLDQAMIESFPTFPYSQVKEMKIGKGALECAVCLNEFDDDDILRLLPKCDHVFHSECIDAWLESHVTCPVCRSNLVLQPGEVPQVPDSQPERDAPAGESPMNDEVSIQVDEDREDSGHQCPEVVDPHRSLNQNRPPRSRSVRGWPFWGRFPRSHSTGHSLVQPGENTDRFTLRLPEAVRKEVVTRALNRTRSLMLPGEGSGRRGYRTGCVGQEGSSRGARYNRRPDQLDGGTKSDRWVFSMAPPFFSRASSVRSPKVDSAVDGEGSTSSRTPRASVTAVKLPSFKCLEPNPKNDETGLASSESDRLRV